jgi:hypothetical protein
MAQNGVWNICHWPLLLTTDIASVDYEFEVMSVKPSVASISTVEDFAHKRVAKLCM